MRTYHSMFIIYYEGLVYLTYLEKQFDDDGMLLQLQIITIRSCTNS